jgi:hypothetical protein
MKRHFFLISLFIISHLAIAQEGDVPLNHYKIPIPPQDYNFNDLNIDERGRLLVAYEKGVLQFDGDSWLKIEINSSPIKFLEIKDTTFLLAKDGIYQMIEDEFHQNKMEQRHAIPLISPIVDLVFFEGKYYLLANDQIIILDEKFNKLDTYESQLGFRDVFVFNNKLFAFEANFLLENVEGTWVDLNLFSPENTDFLFSIKGKNNLYFAYDNGDFYSFNGEEFTPFSSELNEYLKENYPISGKFLDDKIIISTLSGGVVLTEEKTGKITSTIQNYNGLPTNEVTALTMDYQNGLWLAHPYGLSRASLNIPLSDFQFYPGLDGFPEVTLLKNDTLWVGTTEGLFYLNEVKDYETLQKKLVQKIKVGTPEEPTVEPEESSNFLEGLFNSGSNNSEEDFIETELKKYREIYRNEGIRFLALKRKLDEKEQQIRDSIQYANNRNTKSQKNKSSSNPRYRTVVKTIDISRLKSIDFEYQKIKDIDGHVESLTDTDQGLIARSNTGIFILKSENITKISNLKMVKKVLYQRAEKLLWLTNEQGLFSLDLSSDNYSLKKHSENTFNDLIFNNNQLIAVGFNTIEIFSSKDNSLKTIQKLNIVNNFSEELNIFLEDNTVKLLRSDAILELDSSLSKLTIDSVFNPPLKYFLKDQNERIWVLSARDEWSVINGELSAQAEKWLHIVPPVKGINMINDSTIFFSTNERIIRWKYSSSEDYPMPKTFIDGVMVENKWVKNKGFIKLQHGENNLKVILSTPEYLFKEDVEYQYYVKGLMDEWSSWSRNRELDFPYIPTGDYKLQIKARTILNKEINDFDFNFKVMPPYWQTWWFYSLEIAFFSILILVSIKLNTTSQSSYLTKTFTFLTLILSLEFLATILENNLEGYVDDSPVYTFIINVILALSISPIERGISKLLIIFNSSRSKELISEMRKNQLKKKNE